MKRLHRPDLYGWSVFDESRNIDFHGLLWARADGNVLDHDHLSTLRLVATHVAAAVAQAERIAEFEELALRDPLTGLGNRRVLEEKLTTIFERNPVDRQDVVARGERRGERGGEEEAGREGDDATDVHLVDRSGFEDRPPFAVGAIDAGVGGLVVGDPQLRGVPLEPAGRVLHGDIAQ